MFDFKDNEAKKSEFVNIPSFFAKVAGYFILLFWVVITLRNELYPITIKNQAYMQDTLTALVTLLLFMMLHYEIEGGKRA